METTRSRNVRQESHRTHDHEKITRWVEQRVISIDCDARIRQPNATQSDRRAISASPAPILRRCGGFEPQ